MNPGINSLNRLYTMLRQLFEAIGYLRLSYCETLSGIGFKVFAKQKSSSDLFQGVVCSFYIKKLKSKIFSDKKLYKQKCFICPKNLHWEILTKNLVAFKRQDGVNDEKKNETNFYLQIVYFYYTQVTIVFSPCSLPESDNKYVLTLSQLRKTLLQPRKTFRINTHNSVFMASIN